MPEAYCKHLQDAALMKTDFTPEGNVLTFVGLEHLDTARRQKRLVLVADTDPFVVDPERCVKEGGTSRALMPPVIDDDFGDP